MDFTGIQAGQKYSRDAIALYGLIKSPVIVGGLYKFTPRLDLTALGSGV